MGERLARRRRMRRYREDEGESLEVGEQRRQKTLEERKRERVQMGHGVFTKERMRRGSLGDREGLENAEGARKRRREV